MCSILFSLYVIWQCDERIWSFIVLILNKRFLIWFMWSTKSLSSCIKNAIAVRYKQVNEMKSRFLPCKPSCPELSADHFSCPCTSVSGSNHEISARARRSATRPTRASRRTTRGGRRWRRRSWWWRCQTLQHLVLINNICMRSIVLHMSKLACCFLKRKKRTSLLWLLKTKDCWKKMDTWKIILSPAKCSRRRDRSRIILGRERRRIILKPRSCQNRFMWFSRQLSNNEGRFFAASYNRDLVPWLVVQQRVRRGGLGRQHLGPVAPVEP